MRSLGAVLLFVVLLSPCAAALLVPDHAFSGEIVAPAAGDADAGQRLSLLTGRADVAGIETGAFSASGTSDVHVTGVGRLEVLPTLNGKAIGLPRMFEDAEIAVSDNATLVYYIGTTPHQVVAHSDFAMVVALDPPDNYRDLEFKANTSLALVGGTDLVATMTQPGAALLVTNSANATFTVTDAKGKESVFEGAGWSFRLNESGTLHLTARTLLLPFSGDSVARLAPGDLATARERFDVNQLASAYTQAAPDSTAEPPHLDPDLSAQFREGVAIFDGVLLGQPRGTTTVGGVERDVQGFMLYRFDAVALRPGPQRGTVLYEGSGPFLLAGDAIYTTKTAVGPSMPVLSLVLWLFAGAAFVVGRFVPPLVPPGPEQVASPLRLTGLLTRIAAGVLVFVLWDLETRHFLGTSLLTIVGGGGSSQGVAFSAVLGVEFISLMLALFYFGLPVRFIANTALAMGQLKRARGVGKGLGYVAAWGLGAAHFALLLNPFIGLFVDSLGKFP